MNGLRAAFQVELRKALSSRVLVTTTVLLVVGIAVLSGSMVAAAMAGNPQVLAQLGPLADQTGWALLTGITAQISAVAVLLGCGVALSWIVGREFSDGTVAGLFALPITRPAIAAAKLGVYFVWSAAVALALALLVLGGGVLLDLGTVHADTLGRLGRQAALGVLTAMVATPAGWAATLGRGPLAGIAATMVIIVIAQVSVIAAPEGVAWSPLSSPALWALDAAAVGPAQLAMVAILPALSAGLTGLSWRRLQLDR